MQTGYRISVRIFHSTFKCLVKYEITETSDVPVWKVFIALIDMVTGRVVDPDPDWIQIQLLCGSGSVLGIRIRIQGQEN
jgi:hypothetical protein